MRERESLIGWRAAAAARVFHTHTPKRCERGAQFKDFSSLAPSNVYVEFAPFKKKKKEKRSPPSVILVFVFVELFERGREADCIAALSVRAEVLKIEIV